MLSVIIPVYNVEKYLRKCLDSVVNQTYKDLEIILVDDGSTDGSPQICDEYANSFDCIKVLHKPNGGAVSAYILGIEKCEGEYLTFVDSDDWLEPDMYEKMMPYLKDDVNMVFCRYDRVYENKTTIVGFAEEQGYFGRESVDKFFYKINQEKISASRWNKIYLTQDIKDMAPLLDENIRYAEDNLFNHLFAMKYLKKAFYLDEVLYHYRYNEASVSSKFNERKLQDLNDVYRLLNKYDENCEYRRLIANFYLEFIPRMAVAIYRSDVSQKEKERLLKTVLNQPNLRDAVANGEWPCYNIKQRIKKFLLKHKMVKSYLLLLKLVRG